MTGPNRARPVDEHFGLRTAMSGVPRTTHRPFGPVHISSTGKELPLTDKILTKYFLSRYDTFTFIVNGGPMGLPRVNWG